MLTKLLILVVTLNTVLSQLLLKKAAQSVPLPSGRDDVLRFIGDASVSPWIYATLASQGLGFLMWMVLVGREKLGVASASVGAGFYLLVSLSAWVIYGETLNAMQWLGIMLITVGVVCISLSGT